MPTSKRQQRIVLSSVKNQLILKVDEKEIMQLDPVEAMSLGEAMYKIGADIKMKESQ